MKNPITLVKKNLVAILVFTMICTLAAAGYVTMIMPREYTASSKVIIHNGELLSVTAGYQNAEFNSHIEALEELLNSQKMHNHFMTKISYGEKYTESQLSQMIKVYPAKKDSLVFKVKVTAKSSEEAVHLATDFATSMVTLSSSISPRIVVTVISNDKEATVCILKELLIILSAFVLGFILSSVAVSLKGNFRFRLNGAEDYKARYSAKLLGTVPDFNKNREDNDE